MPAARRRQLAEGWRGQRIGNNIEAIATISATGTTITIPVPQVVATSDPSSSSAGAGSTGRSGGIGGTGGAGGGDSGGGIYVAGGSLTLFASTLASDRARRARASRRRRPGTAGPGAWAWLSH